MSKVPDQTTSDDWSHHFDAVSKPTKGRVSQLGYNWSGPLIDTSLNTAYYTMSPQKGGGNTMTPVDNAIAQARGLARKRGGPPNRRGRKALKGVIKGKVAKKTKAKKRRNTGKKGARSGLSKVGKKSRKQSNASKKKKKQTKSSKSSTFKGHK